MKTPKYQEITFAVDSYQNDYDNMWHDIATIQRVLLNAGYLCKVYADGGEPDIVVVQYYYFDEELADGPLTWITWEDYETLLQMHGEEGYGEEESPSN